MAKRLIFNKSEDILRKKCKPVEVFDKKLAKLIDDMKETLVAANGVGLAAPQVGFLRRICVIDTPECGFFELVNPEIIEFSGQQRDVEGCLSCPNEWGYVTRPMKVKFRAFDRNGNVYEQEAEGLFARAVFHECDHLDGKLFLDLVEEFVSVEEQ